MKGSTLQLGVAAIALSVICLIASFVLDVPPVVNLVGIGLGIAGLLLLGISRNKDGGNGK